MLLTKDGYIQGYNAQAAVDAQAQIIVAHGQVLEMVDRSEAYVGIFAWRYGYLPQQEVDSLRPAPVPIVTGAKPGETSITHYEYLRAVERGLTVMAFLLDEHYPWPPEQIDGFDRTRAGAQQNADKIRALRLSLQHLHLPQLRNDLFSGPCAASTRPPCDPKPFVREDHLSGGPATRALRFDPGEDG